MASRLGCQPGAIVSKPAVRDAVGRSGGVIFGDGRPLDGGVSERNRAPPRGSAIVVDGRTHKAALSGLLGSVDAALVHRFHGSVLVVRGGDSEWHERETRVDVA
jgi:hypothetical protein